ncbi:uncharacterized protein NFIA_069770 [Aspergillus fischeri NRRL 181]|uniref:Uncharacterized protein n=1 Tax=Neosartorya fischeri (strain ATCC 1020 / DSM 3700 / CBS 544.65 / FGSC A1164 / JCM 1740 / NRRL 181 / WB 181) TaxID=331117 RepID=A1D7W2_NEOFI|nr:uncharacterized protein NFIA_069770 [Aspergillus fischeri NRRL 181]EAW21806.1 hypothetical protein NFIA_069770 [Aspergillus fischeri NRRL 181]
MDALAGMKTADLFENLSSTLSHIGRLSGTPMSALPSLTWSELLNTVEEMLRIYMVLVARDRPSSEKKTQVMDPSATPQNKKYKQTSRILLTHENCVVAAIVEEVHDDTEELGRKKTQK